MSTQRVCDYCGRTIEDDQSYVVFSVDGEHSDDRWTSGYVGHYHTDERTSRRRDTSTASDCWERVDDGLRLIHDAASSLEAIPVAEQASPSRERGRAAEERPDPEEWRRRLAAGTPLFTLDLTHRAVYALQRADLCTLEEVAQRTEDEVAAIKYVGGTTVQMLRAALTDARLSFRQVEGVAG